MTYLPFIDGMRAVAIAAVVVYHAFPWLLPGGFAGVDVFFVISGFLITRFIATEIESGTFSMIAFFIRRARRLLPASLVCFAAVTVAASFILLPDAYLIYGRSLVSSVLMYSNFHFFKGSGYFSAPALEKPLLHTWSLAVEDQFYLTWPLIAFVGLRRLGSRATVAIAALIALVSLMLAQASLPEHAAFAFYLLPARAWELLTGALVALAAGRIAMPAYSAGALGFAGLIAICASFVLLFAGDNFPGLAALPACLGTAAIIVSGLSQTTFVVRLLSLRPVVWLGLISYSLYLWHWPLISLTSYYLERTLDPVEGVAVVAASTLLAYLSWRFVERPFRHRGGPQAERPFKNNVPFLIAGATGVAALASFAGAVILSKGAPQRFGPRVRPMLEQMVASNPRRYACDNFANVFAPDAICNFGAPKVSGASYDVAVFGDSMADHWVELVAPFANRQHVAARQVTNGGCALFFGVEVPDPSPAKSIECASYQREARKFLTANPNLKLAVISAFWSKWEHRLDGNGGDSLVTASADPQAVAIGAAPTSFEKALDATVKEFTGRGAKVLLIGQIPYYEHLPLRCIVTELRHGKDVGACGLTSREVEAQAGTVNAVLRRVAAENDGVSLFLPADFMCRDGICPPIFDGVMLYKNGGHVNRFGAEYLSRFVAFPALSKNDSHAP